MGLAHILGLDDGGERFLCRSCGRFVRIETAADADDGRTEDAGDRRPEGAGDRRPDDEPVCPKCGSQDVRRIALF